MGIQFDGVNNRVTTGDIVSETGTISGNLGIGGTLTYEDVTNVDSVGVVTARDGLRVTGIATVTGNIDMMSGGTGSVVLGDNQMVKFGDSTDLQIHHAGDNSYIQELGTGSLMIESSGDGIFIQKQGTSNRLADFNIDGDVKLFHNANQKFQTTGSGTITTGIVTAAQSADAVTFLKGNSVGIGSTTTTGRDAGIGTATGEIIYNASDSKMQVWTGTNWESVKFVPPINVSGGTISNSARSGYITHTFTSPGNFVTDGSLTSSEIFVIGGGAGGGGRRYGGGGGAGGAMLATGVTLSAATYGVVVGSGGAGGTYPSPNNGNRGTDGSNSIFNPGGPQQRQGTGGGGGGALDDNKDGKDGGCGGGASSTPPSSGGSSTQPSAPGSGTDYGNRGGNYNTPGGGWAPAGGGGTAANGQDSPGDRVNGGGNGGAGVQLSISGTATYYGGGGAGGSFDYVTPPFPGPYPSPDTMKARGGNGGGGCANSQPNSAPTQSGPGLNPFAAGTGGSSPNQHGVANTGSGGAGMAGAGGYNISPTGTGGNGGSGLVIVAYPKNQPGGEVRF